MKLPSILCALGVTALACAEPSGPADATAPLPNFAEAFTITHEVPLNEISSTCVDELVHITGTAHIKYHETVQIGGGTNTELEYNTQNTQAVALVSGVKYIAGQEFSESVQDIPPGTTQTFVNHFRLMRQGESFDLGTDFVGDDLHFRSILHVTVNANGVITADKFEMERECK